MTIKDLNAKIVKNLDGSDGEITGKKASLRVCAIDALLATYNDEKSEGVESFKRYNLYKKIDVDGTVDLLSEEISLIKTLVGKRFTPLVVGQFYTMIED